MGMDIVLKAAEIKKKAYALGADLCGIASVERFAEAPPGFRPTDIYANCRAVIVLAMKLPGDALFAENCVPYTRINQLMTDETDRLGIRMALELEQLGLKAVPVPSDDPYEYWDASRGYGRAILSMRHAAYMAGLGVLGKNTLLINETYGNMIQIGAVLTDAALQADPLASYEGCLENCTLCIDACPQNALDGVTVDQQLCRPLSNFSTNKGFILKKCNLCRRLCPHALGMKQGKGN